MRYLGTACVILLLALVVPGCDKASPVAPAGTTITLSVNPTRIDISGQASITAIVRRDNGTPVNPGTEVNFSTTLGTLDPDVAKTDDAGVARTVLTGAGQVGMATIEASTGAATPATTEIQIGSLASSVTLVASPTAIGKGGGTIELLAVVRDDAGQLLNELAVNFSTTSGTLESRGAAKLTNQLGEARDTLAVTELDIVALVTNVISVSVFASTEGGSLLETTTDIGVRGLISNISLQVSPGSVAASGGKVKLLALVKDDVGLGVQGAGVNFISQAGTLASGGGVLRTDSGGQVEDTLTLTVQDIDALGTRTFKVEAFSTDSTGAQISASFTVSVQTGAPISDFGFVTSGLSVQFNNQSAGDQPLFYLWDFGDGVVPNPDNRTEVNPVHAYANPGTYPVTLQVTNAVGTNSITKAVEVSP
jgi:PKD repeat protein